MIASIFANRQSTPATDISPANTLQQACCPRWLYWWNGFMVAFAVALLVVDQKGGFGDASKWFFSALIFACIKTLLKHIVS